ncbi:MAG: ABC transporter substrate-binding protein [Candidimonas sp.]|nr:MAG: ABC transporter substrate-binding protein [Candidimonas sp.]
MKSLWFAAIAAATAMALGPNGPAQAAQPILIGASLAESPPGSVVQGTEIKEGLNIMAKMINDKGGVLGRPLKIIYQNDQGIPSQGQAAVTKLITEDHVVAVTGSHQSSVTMADIEVAHRFKIPFVNTNGWADSIREKGYPEVFNPGNYNRRVVEAVVETIKEMKLKNVLAFAENTDFGIGQAKGIANAVATELPGVKYHYEVLDRAGKDFTPAVLKVKSNPPDMIINIMLAPAAYILMNQLYDNNVAPTSKTWFYDAAGDTDNIDFWQNVHQAAVGMIGFGLYDPRMPMPELGKQVAAQYQKEFKRPPDRLLFQAADSLIVIAQAIEHAKSTDSAKMIHAMETMEFHGTRGAFKFSDKPGYTYHQWIDIPYVTYQITALNQPIADTSLVQLPDKPLQVDKLVKSTK